MRAASWNDGEQEQGWALTAHRGQRGLCLVNWLLQVIGHERASVFIKKKHYFSISGLETRKNFLVDGWGGWGEQEDIDGKENEFPSILHWGTWWGNGPPNLSQELWELGWAVMAWGKLLDFHTHCWARANVLLLSPLLLSPPGYRSFKESVIYVKSLCVCVCLEFYLRESQGTLPISLIPDLSSRTRTQPHSPNHSEHLPKASEGSPSTCTLSFTSGKTKRRKKSAIYDLKT